MKPSAATILSDSWRLWRADWSLLLGAVAPFTFLPVFAAHLLLPPQPERAAGDTSDAATAQFVDATFAWFQSNAGWLILLFVIGQFAALTILHLYLDRPRPSAGGALTAALKGLPFFIAAMILLSIPAGAGALLLILPGIYVLARLSLIGPVMVVERVRNPVDAMIRSVERTKGIGFTLTSVVLIVMLAGFLAQQPLIVLDDWMLANANNPVARAIVDALAAGVATLAAIANALTQVATWRRISSS